MAYAINGICELIYIAHTNREIEAEEYHYTMMINKSAIARLEEEGGKDLNYIKE